MSTSILNCRTQAQTTPLGIDYENPTFSWQMATSRTGASRPLTVSSFQKMKP